MTLSIPAGSHLEKLRLCKDLGDLASLLGYTAKSLSYIIYRIHPNARYREFTIPKSDGSPRQIKSPNDRLKRLQ